ncbi:LPXTG cell wall anchor domain-containing protein [Candidatus Bathyarchaeota archaeon]|nr:LPXTG cell wall anchor domain-containing protein [Candidatus Bathyarchaeota archaeon]
MTGGANTGPTDDALPGPEDATEDAAAADDGSGLSTGASAGIGVGVGVAVLAIIAAVFFLLRRRKKNAGEAAAAAAVQNYHEVPGAAVKGDGPTYEKAGDTPASSVPIAEAPTRDTGAQEIDGTTHVVPHLFPMELDSTEVPHSPGSTRFTVSPTLSPAPAPAPPMSPMNPNHR